MVEGSATASPSSQRLADESERRRMPFGAIALLIDLAHEREVIAAEAILAKGNDLISRANPEARYEPPAPTEPDAPAAPVERKVPVAHDRGAHLGDLAVYDRYPGEHGHEIVRDAVVAAGALRKLDLGAHSVEIERGADVFGEISDVEYP